MVQYDTCVLQNLLPFRFPTLFPSHEEEEPTPPRCWGHVIVRVFFFFFFIVIIICILLSRKTRNTQKTSGQPRVVVIHQSFEKNTKTGDDDSYDGRHSK